MEDHSIADTTQNPWDGLPAHLQEILQTILEAIEDNVQRCNQLEGVIKQQHDQIELVWHLS